MASTSETGHAKNISNFQVLIEACDSYGNKHQPSENELVLAALNAQYTTCDAAQNAMKNPLAAYGQAELGFSCPPAKLPQSPTPKPLAIQHRAWGNNWPAQPF